MAAEIGELGDLIFEHFCFVLGCGLVWAHFFFFLFGLWVSYQLPSPFSGAVFRSSDGRRSLRVSR